MSTGFRPMMLDDCPELLEQSYRLRYQVYCVERNFLAAEDYPDHREVDEFDRNSVHVGVVDAVGDLAGTARLVKFGQAGLPLLAHCVLFPNVTTLADPNNTVVEVSRVSISRHYARRRGDPPFLTAVVSADEAAAMAARWRQRRQHLAEPFITLLKAVIFGAKRSGATHLIGATDAALHRWLVHYGFPYRMAGPEAEYYGRIAPHIMSLAELDQVILGRQFAVLDDFPVGMDPELWPKQDQDDYHTSAITAAAFDMEREGVCR